MLRRALRGTIEALGSPKQAFEGPKAARTNRLRSGAMFSHVMLVMRISKTCPAILEAIF